MSEERPPILDVDWRYRVATTLEEDCLSPYTGVLHKKGSPIIVSTFFRHGDRRITVGDPSAPALFLSQSHKAYERALEIHPFLGKRLPASGEDPSIRVYDYLESIMASIVFAYMAIEAFANEELPENFTYEIQRASGLSVAYRKESIERHINLDEKLAKALPEAVEKPTPKGSKTWENYVHLRRLRHRIVHIKSVDRARSKGDNLFPDSIWSILLDPKQPNYPLIAKNMILHFRGKEDTHWLKYCPF